MERSSDEADDAVVVPDGVAAEAASEDVPYDEEFAVAVVEDDRVSSCLNLSLFLCTLLSKLFFHFSRVNHCFALSNYHDTIISLPK